MTAVPEVKAKIESEELTLTSAVKLAAFVRREECEPEKTVELLEKISGTSTRKTEEILAREVSEPILRRDHLKPTGPETTRVSFDADPEFMEMLERLKDLQGNPGLSLCERLKSALRTEIERKADFRPRRSRKARTLEREKSAPSREEGRSPSDSSETSVPLSEHSPLKAAENRSEDLFRDSSENPLQDSSVDPLKKSSEAVRLRAPEARPPEVHPTEDSRKFEAVRLRAPEVHPPEAPRKAENPKKRSRHIPVSVKREVAVRSGGRCEFVDPATRLASFFLQNEESRHRGAGDH